MSLVFSKASSDQRILHVASTTTGTVVRERLDPRASFAGHVMNTPWHPLQRAYFNGYALWTYLTTPSLMAMPGFEVAEISPWQEGGEFWLGLRAVSGGDRQP